VQASGNDSDEALMMRFQNGDRAVFSVLVRRHQTSLYNFALRHLRSSATAEEVVQETFMRVVQNAHEFRHAARFTAWLYTIARNLCIDAIRRRAHAPLPSLGETAGDRGGDRGSAEERTADARANVEQAAVSTEIRERLLLAIEQLPDEQREVFLLRELSNLPFRDIATAVGAPENTVKSRMRYALERLQQALCEFEEYARALR
jgi:RNA polymerase sigma-70 factor (ECF subfamily)